MTKGVLQGFVGVLWEYLERQHRRKYLPLFLLLWKSVLISHQAEAENPLRQAKKSFFLHFPM